MSDSAVIFDSEGRVAMVVHDARNLSDPAFNPNGCVQVRMKRADYDACRDKLSLLKAASGPVLLKDAKIGAAVQAETDAIEAEIAAKALKAEQDLL